MSIAGIHNKAPQSITHSNALSREQTNDVAKFSSKIDKFISTGKTNSLVNIHKHKINISNNTKTGQEQFIASLHKQLATALRENKITESEKQKIEEEFTFNINLNVEKDIKISIPSDNQKVKFIFHRSVNNEAMIVKLEKKIGKGSYGKVKTVTTIDSKETCERAIKLALKKFPNLALEISKPEQIKTVLKEKKEAAVDDVKNEYEIIKWIHEKLQEAGRDGVGIQAAPYHLFNYIDPQTGNIELGYIGVKYDGDAKQLIRNKDQLSSADICNISTQIMTGLESFQTLGLHHGDIKPQNIFFKKSNNTYEVCLADYGGVKSIIEKSKNRNFGTFTNIYTCPNDNPKNKSSELSIIQKLYETAEIKYDVKDKIIINFENTVSEWNQKIINYEEKALESNPSKVQLISEKIELLESKVAIKEQIVEKIKRDKRIDYIEMLELKRAYDNMLEKSDIYSTSLVIYELITGENLQYLDKSNEVKTRDFDHQSFQDKGIPTTVTNMLQKALDQDCDNRPSATEFLEVLKKWKETV